MKKRLFIACLLQILGFEVFGQACYFTGQDSSWSTGFVGNGTASTSRIVAMVAKPDGLYCLFESPIGLKLSGGAPSVSVVNKWNGAYWQAVGPAFPYTGSTATFSSMTLDSDGNLIIAGRFTTSLGSPSIVKLNLSTQSYEPIGLGIGNGTSYVQKIGVYQDTLYVLGRFSDVRDSSQQLSVKNIARYYLKTNRWDSLGSGISDFIQGYQSTWIPLGGLAISPTGEVFVAGNFTTIGPNSYYNGIASWKSGRGWDSLGIGLRAFNGTTPARGIPYTVSYNPDDSGVYVGGYVGYLQNAPITNRRQNGIARYKHGNWEYDFGSYSALCYQSYYDSSAHAVFFGGGFAKGTVGGNLSDANHIGRLNHVLDSVFELGHGITVGSDVSAMVRWNNKLYVAGNFSEADSSVKAYNLASWDGSNWSAIGHGIEAINNNAWVKAMAADNNGNLILGGNFKSLGGQYTNAWALIDSNHVVQQLGNDLQSLNGQTQVSAILVLNDSTYLIGGKFSKSFPSGNASALAAYDIKNNTWSKLGTYGVGSIYQYVNCMVKVGNRIVVGGNFSSIDGVSASNLAYWDGSQWNAMGDPNGEVEHLSVFEDSILYIEGFFSSINGSTHNYIARFDNNTWRTVGVGLYASPQDMAVHPHTGELWILGSGSIPNPSGPSFNSNGYAVWDGTAWKDYGRISGFLGSYNAIHHALDSTTFLTCSGASTIGNNNASNVLRYHPAYGWAGTGSGIKRFSSPYMPEFYVVHTHKNKLYIGGRFEIAGDSIQSLHLAAYALDNPLGTAATLSLGKDTTALFGYSVFAQTSPVFDSLVWSTGDKNTLYANVQSTGYYWAKLYNQGCTVSDTVYVNITGNNIHLGGSMHGADRSEFIQNAKLRGGGADAFANAHFEQEGKLKGGSGAGHGLNAMAQNGKILGGRADASGVAEYGQQAKLKGGQGDAGAVEITTQYKSIYKGGRADAFTVNTFIALPDGIVQRFSSPVHFNEKDSSDLSVWIANLGDFPIYAFKMTWFIGGKEYTFQEFTDTLSVGDSMEVKAMQRIFPSEKDLPLDICAVISHIANEKDTGNNQLCMILEKTNSILDPLHSHFDILIYPNPSNGIARLAIHSESIEESDFVLYGSDGKKVYTQTIAAQTKEIDLSLQDLIPGIYTFQFKQGKNTITGKIAIVN
ncbi:MAG: T9SS type A sorting domain-containing protein [Bacteroidetes bacterium]|nr:MAG: T9SS type A sorting domain-containing protein [Bacteroidota bacterium]